MRFPTFPPSPERLKFVLYEASTLTYDCMFTSMFYTYYNIK